jgi:diketogulonate reductase-like aldo/keto reductase
MSDSITQLRFPSGGLVPRLGQGTWHMGENRKNFKKEIDSLKVGLDLGMSLIDTAEMYADGGAEEVIAGAINGRREEVYLISKVYPHNATRSGVAEACERSLRRLGTEYLDLYLLHWPGPVPLEETIDGFRALREAGKIRDYGVSNFDIDDMEEIAIVPGGDEVRANQVLYNLQRRGVEWDLLPWCQERGVIAMAYSPIEQGRLLSKLAVVARARGAAPAQIALAWLLRHEALVAIPKSGNPDHVRENHGALAITLTNDELRELDRPFQPPANKVSLQML